MKLAYCNKKIILSKIEEVQFLPLKWRCHFVQFFNTYFVKFKNKTFIFSTFLPQNYFLNIANVQ